MNRKNKKTYRETTWRLLVGILILSSVMLSCKKNDASYKQYIQGGEIIYVSKPDSVRVLPGKNRVGLHWWKGTDPRVSRAHVYSHNGELISEVRLDKESAGIVKIMLEDLTEGTHMFDIVTLDDEGNESVKVRVSGTSYGERYQSTLQSRRIQNATFDGKVQLNWYSPTPDAIATEIIYENPHGDQVVHTVPSTEKQTVLYDYQPKREIKYRTLFKPDSSSIDTFHTDYINIALEYELDKSKFKRWNVSSFPYTEYEIGNGYNIEKLWDNVYTGYGYIYLESEPLPRSFTFDLGQLAIIDKIRLSPNWESQLYANGNIKRAEIWGSDTPDVSDDYATWRYLGRLDSFKPSGLPLGQTSANDLNYAQAGENFDLSEDRPPVRYIRFVVQDTWSGSISMHITELTFWGEVIDALN